MKANRLSDEKMRELGFIDYNKDIWYLCKIIHEEKYKNRDKWYVSFNLSINKKTLKCKIDVLDEEFLQPYPYKKHEDMVKKVNAIINDLKEKGVIYD